MRNPALLAVVLLLCACQSTTGFRYQTAPTPEPVLTSVTLNEDFRIRPDRASEYIQYGEIRPYDKISEYYPHCIFELRTVAASERTVQPETFTVTGIHRDRFMASLDGLLLASSGGGDYNMVMSTTTISLHSDRQPDVFRLSCRQLEEPFRARHVTLAQMQQALGDMFTLR